VPAPSSFDYATLRVVPCAERGEFLNAGVVMHCPEAAFLECRVRLDEPRLRALWPELDLDLVRSHLEAFPKVTHREAFAPGEISLAGGAAQHGDSGFARTQRDVPLAR